MAPDIAERGNRGAQAKKPIAIAKTISASKAYHTCGVYALMGAANVSRARMPTMEMERIAAEMLRSETRSGSTRNSEVLGAREGCWFDVERTAIGCP